MCRFIQYIVLYASFCAPYLPLIEDTASYIFMIHPRRFGKSLFLSIMKAYYDILQKDRFESYSADYE